MDIGKDLTKRQQEIFDFIKKYSAKYGYPPTVRDIGKAVGLASSSTVHAHLANLEKAGLLRRDPSKPRAIEMLDRATSGVVDAVKSVVGQGGLPLVGQVAAGQPILAEENIEEYVSVPELAGGDEGEYVLRIRGESMKNAGILEGDYVVVRRQDTATDGEIVVALVGEDATVKRFFREDDHVRLQPENDSYGADPLARGARARPGGRRVEDGRVSAALAAPPAARARGRRADARRRARRGVGRGQQRRRHRVPGLRGLAAAALVGRRGRRRRPLRRLRHDARVAIASGSMSEEEDRAELAELEQGWMQAMQDRDEARLEELVAPRLPLHRAAPRARADVARAVDGRRAGRLPHHLVRLPVDGHRRVRRHRGDPRALLADRELRRGQPLARYWLTDIWARRDGRWQVVARHSSILS